MTPSNAPLNKFKCGFMSTGMMTSPVTRPEHHPTFMGVSREQSGFPPPSSLKVLEAFGSFSDKWINI